MSQTRPLSPELDARIASDPELTSLLRRFLNEAIGQSLREAREHANLSQAEVATAMNISRSRVSQIEAAEGSSLSLNVLGRYATAVGCRLDIDLVDPATEETISSIFITEDIDAWNGAEAIITQGGREFPATNTRYAPMGFGKAVDGENQESGTYANAA